jgi:hypothetical protein
VEITTSHSPLITTVSVLVVWPSSCFSFGPQSVIISSAGFVMLTNSSQMLKMYLRAVPIFVLTLGCAVRCWAGTVSFSNYVAYATGSSPEAVAIADFNGDGRNDVVMSTSFSSNTNDNSILVFFQNASGGLNPPVRYAVGANANSIAVGDFNGDGRKDIAVGKTGNGIRVFWNDGSGGFTNFTDYTTANSYWICAGDFNNDGRTDLAGIGWASGKVDVFTQATNGTLALTGQYSASYDGNNDLKAGDVDGDGLTDIVVMNGQGYTYPNVSVLLQTNGGFATAVPFSLGSNQLTAGVGIGDTTGDGRTDVVICYGGNRPTSMISVLNQASGVLSVGATYASYDVPEGIAVADLDMDGSLDAVTLHGGWQQAGVYLQNSLGAFDAERLFPLPYASSYNPHGVAVGDINGDGRPDIVLADYNHGLVVLYNSSKAPALRITRIKINPATHSVSLTIPYLGPHGSNIIERSDSLNSWTPVATNSDSTWTDTSATAAAGEHHFYRVRAP